MSVGLGCSRYVVRTCTRIRNRTLLLNLSENCSQGRSWALNPQLAPAEASCRPSSYLEPSSRLVMSAFQALILQPHASLISVSRRSSQEPRIWAPASPRMIWPHWGVSCQRSAGTCKILRCIRVKLDRREIACLLLKLVMMLRHHQCCLGHHFLQFPTYLRANLTPTTADGQIR